MIKLIASDMDGTLVNSDHKISAYNVSMIKEAQAKGIEFIVSTGRSYEDTHKQVEDAGISCNYLVMNGSELRNSKGELIQATYLKNELVKEIVKLLEDDELYVELYTTAGIYSLSTKEIAQHAVATKMNLFNPHIPLDEAYFLAADHEQFKKIDYLDSIDDFLKNGVKVGKILTFSNDENKLNYYRNFLPEKYQVNANGSFVVNLEITDSTASKGNSLKKYAASRGINLSEVMTIGDSFNDLSMLQKEFGVTVGMGNALEEIKEIVKYVTETNDNDGVGKAIKKYIKR